jgi:hypothetical protein
MKLNPTYLRVGFYFIAPMLGAVPGVTVDMAAGIITIDIDTFIAGLVVAAGASGWVFSKWGKK